MQVLSCWADCHLGRNGTRPAYWVLCKQQDAEAIVVTLTSEKQQEWRRGRCKPDRNGDYYFLVDSAREFILPMSYWAHTSGQVKAGHCYRFLGREIQVLEEIWKLE